MAFFITKEGKRKSPMALVIFFVILFYLAVFAVLYAVLLSPLHKILPLGDLPAASWLHSAVIALIGTLLCCSLFLLPDKRIVPYAFSASPVVPGMMIAAAVQLPAERRNLMIYVTLLYTLMPILIGNLTAWSIYRKKYRKRCGKKDA